MGVIRVKFVKDGKLNISKLMDVNLKLLILVELRELYLLVFSKVGL